MIIHSFRDLRVWQAGMELVTHVYQITSGFPREEMYGLSSQLRRAAVSIPSNIAEGHARESSKEYLNHLSMAQGSLAELQTQIEIALRLSFIEEQMADTILALAAALSRQIFALRNSIARKVEEGGR
ncbi:MAG TPA: four helix bundle protein [Roseiflexaceae bacterium]|nr:four helix bundle protein [Roseiflexaceae bacterium]